MNLDESIDDNLDSPPSLSPMRPDYFFPNHTNSDCSFDSPPSYLEWELEESALKKKKDENNEVIVLFYSFVLICLSFEGTEEEEELR